MPPLIPNAIQFTISWRANNWIVLRDTWEVGHRPSFAAAVALVRAIIERPEAAEQECLLIVRDRYGTWHDLPCSDETWDRPAGDWDP